MHALHKWFQVNTYPSFFCIELATPSDLLTLVQDGLTIHAVERFITEQREEFASQILLRLKHQIELANGVTLSSEELSRVGPCNYSTNQYQVMMQYPSVLFVTTYMKTNRVSIPTPCLLLKSKSASALITRLK